MSQVMGMAEKSSQKPILWVSCILVVIVAVLGSWCLWSGRTQPAGQTLSPSPSVANISEEQAIDIALSQSVVLTEMQQRGELTITTKLTVHGDTQAGTTGDLQIHSQLPVWMVYVQVPPWKELRGPVGQQIEVQFDTERYEIDAMTGKLLGGGRTYTGGRIP